MMRLPNALEQRLWQDMQTIEGETKIPYITSVERLAIQRGLQRGRLEDKREGQLEDNLKGKLEGEAEKAAAILECLLAKHFGPLDEKTRERLATATLEQLDLWTDRVLDVSIPNAVFEGH